MKTFTVLVAVAIFGAFIVRTEFILYHLQAERNRHDLASYVTTIQASSDRTGSPTPTPPGHDTMHVTQKIQCDDPDVIQRIIQFLHFRDKK